MPARTTRRLVALVTALAAVPSASFAQILASEHGSVSQTVDGTTITVPAESAVIVSTS